MYIERDRAIYELVNESLNSGKNIEIRILISTKKHAKLEEYYTFFTEELSNKELKNEISKEEFLMNLVNGYMNQTLDTLNSNKFIAVKGHDEINIVFSTDMVKRSNVYLYLK